MFLYSPNFLYNPPNTKEKLYVKINRYNYIQNRLLELNCKITTPTQVGIENILSDLANKIHAKEYLEALISDAYYYAYCFGVFEYSKSSIDNLINGFLKPQLFHAHSTLETCKYALQDGFAVNLSGGHHHALYNLGEGFCLVNDIAYACNNLGDIKILIIDADAHRGNGVAQLLGSNPNVSIMDIFNAENYPTGEEHKEFIDYKIELPSGGNDSVYLPQFEKTLYIAINSTKPDLVIFNAGADILENDMAGGLGVSHGGLKQRDALVAQICKKNKIPLGVVLSGSYEESNFDIIAWSLFNIKNIITGQKYDI